MRIYRATIHHTPRNPFEHENALESIGDAGLVVEGEQILAMGDFETVRPFYANAELIDLRPAIVLPGLIDCHVHFPQVGVIGTMGLQLLDWLHQRTLPEEALLEDSDYAREVAKDFLAHLVRNGTTSALVFGAHFKNAMHAFFEEARNSGLRITSGMVFSDRMLRPELHQTPKEALHAGMELLERWHHRGRLRYAVMPRFALSCTDQMLEVCRKLFEAKPGVLFHSHINENPAEIELVNKLAGAQDYLEAYERHQLVSNRSVFAHNVHPSENELTRMAKAHSSVAHCASSNAFIGSGLMPLRRHLAHGVHVALGTDVGGGTGFSLLKEGLEAYQMQMLHTDGLRLSPAHLLYLATRAGAKALGLEGLVGDFSVGKQADFVVIQPPKGSTLERTLTRSPSLELGLGALFTLAREESIAQVYVAGERKHSRA